MAGSDLIAIGIVRELGRLGLRVPQDISVVGFDNIPSSELCNPPLSAIEIPVHEMGAEAVQLLIRRIGSPHESRRRVVYEVSAVQRGSVAAAAA